MGIRRTAGRGLDRVVGPKRTAALRRAEAGARSRLIDLLDLEGQRPERAKVEQEIRRRADRQRAKKQATKKQAAKRTAAKTTARRPATREELIEAIGRRSPEGVSHRPTKSLPWASADPSAEFPKADGTRHELLAGLHELLRPRTYFEIGVDNGNSMAQSRTRSIGVDPAFNITAPIHCDVRIFRETSDDFFAMPDAFEHFGSVPVDLAFIDGMHLAEFALRDFMNIEKHMSRAGVVILDDMLPRNSLEAYRTRRTLGWAGDVYKVHEVLATYRPDLTVVPINTNPTGSYLVVGLDPDSTVLDEHYAEIEPTLTQADPQTVPQDWLQRRTAVNARQLLDLDVWGRLAKVRDTSEADPQPEDLRPLWDELRALPTIWG